MEKNRAREDLLDGVKPFLMKESKRSRNSRNEVVHC